ncbi:hypothetical protein LCGC14_2490560, partial [marine sediment metagenome]
FKDFLNIRDEKNSHITVNVRILTLHNYVKAIKNSFGFIPNDVNISSRTRTSQGDPLTSTEFDSDDAVVIRDGELLTGTIDRKAIGADESESVLHVVVKDHGSDRAREFIDSLTQMLLKYLSHLGFSLGLNTINFSDDVKLRISKGIANAEKEVDNIIQSYKQKHFEKH